MIRASAPDATSRSCALEPTMPFPGRDKPWLTVLGWLLSMLVFANTAAYIAYAGNPLVASDGWYFINVFLRKAVESGPEIQDFFVKRGGFDHAQPLVKGLLFLNARLFGLDYVFEALIGLMLAAAMLVFIMRTTQRDRIALQPQWLRVFALVALSATLVTLNSGMVFNWSLVTLVYISYLLAVIGAAAAWRGVAHGRWGALIAASLLIAFTQDDVGLIINAVLAIAAMLAAGKMGRWRRGLVVAAVVMASEMGYMIISSMTFDAGAGAGQGTMGAGIHALWSHRGESLGIARIVLGSTLAHLNPLLYYFPTSAVAWQGGLAILAALAHAWFWWRAWRCRWNLPVFYAVVVMLLFYALVAGVLYARVPEFGVAYLGEPRYVAFYLLSNVALVLMLMGQPFRAAKRPGWTVACLSLAVLLAWQIPLSRFTWREGSYLAAYYHTMAAQMIELGSGTMPSSCVPLLTVCNMPLGERADAILFLKRNNLNIYSRAFVERYRLENLVPADSRSSGK